MWKFCGSGGSWKQNSEVKAEATGPVQMSRSQVNQTEIPIWIHLDDACIQIAI